MNAAFYVEDAYGKKFLYTIADPDYANSFKTHARWWIRRSLTKAYAREAHQRGFKPPAHPCRIIAGVSIEEVTP